MVTERIIAEKRWMFQVLLSIITMKNKLKKIFDFKGGEFDQRMFENTD